MKTLLILVATLSASAQTPKLIKVCTVNQPAYGKHVTLTPEEQSAKGKNAKALMQKYGIGPRLTFDKDFSGASPAVGCAKFEMKPEPKQTPKGGVRN